MRRLQAQRDLDRLMTSGARVSPDALYDLTLEATGDKAQAEAAMMALIKARLRRGEEVE